LVVFHAVSSSVEAFEVRTEFATSFSRASPPISLFPRKHNAIEDH
jgi:hypothetical protein